MFKIISQAIKIWLKVRNWVKIERIYPLVDQKSRCPDAVGAPTRNPGSATVIHYVIIK